MVKSLYRKLLLPVLFFIFILLHGVKPARLIMKRYIEWTEEKT